MVYFYYLSDNNLFQSHFNRIFLKIEFGKFKWVSDMNLINIFVVYLSKFWVIGSFWVELIFKNINSRTSCIQQFKNAEKIE